MAFSGLPFVSLSSITQHNRHLTLNVRSLLFAKYGSLTTLKPVFNNFPPPSTLNRRRILTKTIETHRTIRACKVFEWHFIMEEKYIWMFVDFPFIVAVVGRRRLWVVALFLRRKALWHKCSNVWNHTYCRSQTLTWHTYVRISIIRTVLFMQLKVYNSQQRFVYCARRRGRGTGCGWFATICHTRRGLKFELSMCRLWLEWRGETMETSAREMTMLYSNILAWIMCET